MHWSHPCRLLLSTLLASILQHADGCGRKPARTKSTPTTIVPTTSTTAFPTPRPSHRKSCTPDEVSEAKCIHGKCFALELGGDGKRSAHCNCDEMWTGRRCEMIDEDFFGEYRVLSADKVAKAGIATGVVAVVSIITIVVAYIVITRRKRRKQREEESNKFNGCAQKNLINKDGTAFEDGFPDKSETKV